MPDRVSTSASQEHSEPFDLVDEANEAFAAVIRKEAERELRADDEPDTTANVAVRARCALKEMRRLFEHRGWKILPKNERGRRILRLGADLAWLAGPSNPKLSVRRWCRRYGQAFSRDELDTLVSATETSNKRWTADQIATVLGVTAKERAAMGFRQIGACDDSDYEKRRKIRRENGAASQRRSRAATSTGRKRGRPALNLSPEEKQRRKRDQNAKRARKYRASRKTTPVASRKNASTILFITKTVDEIKRDAPIREPCHHVIWHRHYASTGRARKRPALHVVDTLHGDTFSKLIKGAVAVTALHSREKLSDTWLNRQRLSTRTIATI